MAYTAPTFVASGTTFAQFQSGGPSGHLERLIAAQGATVAPTVAATANPTGGGASGGAMVAGTYYFVVTELNGFGETTAGPEGSQLTVGATNIPRVTFQTLKSGNVARNLYFGAKGGSTGGPYYLYASNISAATYDCAVAVPAGSYGATQPPTINSTGLSYSDANSNVENMTLQLLRSAKTGNLEVAYQWLCQVVDNFNTGQPMSFNTALMKLRHAHAVFAALSTICSEMGTLIDANPGTRGNAATGIGGRQNVRTWP